MAVREVDESEYIAAQNVVSAVNGMMKNPAARKLVLQARKLADPNASIPELDAAEPIMSDMATLRQELAADRAERKAEKEAAAAQAAQDSFAAKWNDKRQAIRAQGYNEDYVKQVEDLAHERGIADLDAAQALFDRLNPQPSVSEPGGSDWNFFGDPGAEDQGEYMKRLMQTRGDDERVLGGEVSRTLQDIRTNSPAPRR